MVSFKKPFKMSYTLESKTLSSHTIELSTWIGWGEQWTLVCVLYTPIVDQPTLLNNSKHGENGLKPPHAMCKPNPINPHSKMVNPPMKLEEQTEKVHEEVTKGKIDNGEHGLLDEE